jgi:hypothetical protein
VLAWFRHADFARADAPAVRKHGWTGLLPETFTAWRGGTGSPGDVAAGLAWTLDRGLALGWAAALSRVGRATPVVLRREASRAEALFRGRAYEREVVLPPGRGWRVDTADRPGILFAGPRDTARRRREALATHAAWGSRFPTWRSFFGSVELPA